MPRKKRDKSAVEPNTEPNRRTKTAPQRTKLDSELDNALSLVHEEPIQEPSSTHAGTKALMKYNAERREIDLEPVKKISIDKHVESTRYKIAYVVDKLADELMREASKKTKRDKEYMKGLTWSFGTLYDKLSCVSTDAHMVALPSKLLANVTEMLKAQTELLKASHVSSSPQGPKTTEPQVHTISVDEMPSQRHELRSSPSVQQDTSEDYVGSNDDSSLPQRSATDEKLRT